MNIVVTTIFPPTPGAIRISSELNQSGGELWVIGDRGGPPAYDLPNTHFFDINRQLRLPFRLARLLSEKHYARKNLGYLLAIRNGVPFLVETDDDNIPQPNFWLPRSSSVMSQHVRHAGWFNVYLEFCTGRIWPRGFPLEEIQHSFARRTKPESAASARECLIQQGLANRNPDVDAVYRLVCPLPLDFESRSPVSLAAGCWCPFNSQNTTFFQPAFPLLYLPTFCSFRMTDIWRSFVAQRCLWEMESAVCFTEPTVYQERNEHNLHKDFEDEVPGYLKNNTIRGLLENVSLKAGDSFETVSENLLICYEALVRGEILPKMELRLVEAWNGDLASLA